MNGKRSYAWAWTVSLFGVIGIVMLGTMAQAATISGTVYDSAASMPLTGVQIDISVQQGNPCGNRQWAAGASTNSADGAYTITDVPAGTYYLQTYNNGTAYVDEWWNASASSFICGEAQSVTVGESTVLEDLDFQLAVGGAITGHVYVSGGATPISDVCISAEDPADGQWRAGNNTDSDGYYSMLVPTGSYVIHANPGCNDLPYVGGYYQNVYLFSEATSVSVTAPGTVADIDFNLSQGGTISGQAIIAGTSTPIQNLHVYAVDFATGNWMNGVNTGTDGTYTIHVPGGGYKVCSCPGCSGLLYVEECYNNRYGQHNADSVSVTDSIDTPNINFALDVGGSISGQATIEGTSTPINNVHIYAVDFTTGDWIAGSNTGPDGIYSFRAPTGAYKVCSCTNCTGLNYINKCYNDKPDQQYADQVDVTELFDTPDIDFAFVEGGAISGTIYEGTGSSPITGGQIGIQVLQGTPCGQYNQVAYQNANPDGTYEITGVPAGSYYLRTQNNGANYLNEWWDDPNSTLDCNDAEQVTVTAGATTSGRNFQLDAGGTVAGTIYPSGSESPLTDAEIWVSVMQGDSACQWLQHIQGTSTTNGVYTLAGLPAGEYYVITNNGNQSNYVNEWWDSPNSTPDCNHAQKVTITAGGTTSDIDFQLDLGGTVAGTIYPNGSGSPLTDAEIWVNVMQGSSACQWLQHIQGTSTTTGIYTIVGIPVGEYYVSTNNGNQSNYLDEWWDDPDSTRDCNEAQKVTVTAGNTVSDIDFQLDRGGRITGHAYQSGGATPISDVCMSLEDPSNGQWQAGNNTDSSGYYSILVPAGSYVVHANPGCNSLPYVNEYYQNVYYFDQATPVSVTTDGTTSNIDFQLDAGATITGHVYQSGGATPIAHVCMSAEDPDNGQWRGGDNTDDTGYYALVVPSGSYVIHANPDCNSLPYVGGYYDHAYTRDQATPIAVTAPNTTTGIDFSLIQGGTISGQATIEGTSTPINNMHLYAVDFATGDWIGGSNTGAEGNYSIRLPEGAYKVCSCTNCTGLNYINECYNNKPDQDRADQVDVTDAHDTANIDFALAEGGTITGTVYRSDGITPVTGVWIGVSVQQGTLCNTQWVTSTQTDSTNGTYVITGLPSGTYYLRTQNDGTHNYIEEWWASPGSVFDCSGAQTVTVTAGSTSAGNDFQLDLGGAISGTAYQSDGITPITGVSVNVIAEQGPLCDTDQVVGTVTDSNNGTYMLTGVPVGTYYVKTGNYGTHDYVGEWWASPNSVMNCSGAQTVTVTAGETVSGRDFQLELGGAISGIVYQSDGSTPITGVQIRITARQDPCGANTGWGNAGTDTTNGIYTIRGVPAGTYYLQSYNQNQSNYVNAWWNASGSSLDCADAQSMVVTSGGALTGRDFQLNLGGSISGTVYQSDGTTPVTGVRVDVGALQNGPCGPTQWVAGNSTNSMNGTYTIFGIPVGTYYLRTGNSSTHEYVSEWWASLSSQLDCQNAQTVTITSGGTIIGMNFQLDQGGAISGTLYKSDGVTLANDAPIWVAVWQGSSACGSLQYRNSLTTSIGTYTLHGIPAGATYVFAESDGGLSGYAEEWWATPLSTGDCDKAQTVPVTVGNTAAGRNFQLAWNVPEMAVRQDNTHIPSGTGNYIFGAVNLGSNASRIFTIQNVGTANLTLTGTPKVTISGANPGDFSVTVQPTSPVTANSSVTFTVQFTPMASGTRTATVTIANNDTDENPYTFVMTGKGRYLTFVEKQQNGLDGVDGLDSVYGVTVSPDGAHVYAASYQDHAVAVFSRNATTGALTFVETQKDGAGSVNGLAGATAVSVSPDGAHVYVASQHDHAVAVFSRNATTGALTFVEMQQDGVNGVNGLGIADAVTVSPDGLHVYATGYSDNAVVVFSRNPITGTLTFVETQLDGINGVQGLGLPRSVAVSLDGRHIYVTGYANNAVVVFSRNATTGALAFVEAQFDGINGVDGLNGVHMAKISPDGAHLYVASYHDSAVAVFQRNVTTGALTFVEMQQHGLNGVEGLAGACAVAVSSDGAHVYTADWDGSSLTVFQRNRTTGRLTYLEIKHEGIDDVDGMSNAHDVEVSPDSTHVYAAGAGDDALAVFASRWMPEINVKQGTTNIPSGGSYNFGSVNLGSNVSRVFTIQNIGTTNLTLTGTPRVGISGTHAANFNVTAQPASPVAPAGSTTFTLRFAPTAAGTRTATVSIANTDSNENPYTFTVTGTGQPGNAYLLWTK